jgi:hypothetical protein
MTYMIPGKSFSDHNFRCNVAEELPGEELKAKKSELRLYCDLLMQQVHQVKSAVQSTEQPDVEVRRSLKWMWFYNPFAPRAEAERSNVSAKRHM